jgi:signal transduction histidine kinase
VGAAARFYKAPPELTLLVHDDGCGFDPVATVQPDGAVARPDGGVGLQSLRERVARRGGTLTLDSRPGHGVSLTVCLPLPARHTIGGFTGSS